MQWLSAEVTVAKIETLAAQDALFKAYALSLFVDRAFYSADFAPSEAWAKVVVPTDSGQEILQALADAGHRFSPHIRFSLSSGSSITVACSLTIKPQT